MNKEQLKRELTKMYYHSGKYNPSKLSEYKLCSKFKNVVESHSSNSEIMADQFIKRKPRLTKAKQLDSYQG